MKPHIICHMVSSVDGRTDDDALDAVTTEGEYDATADTFGRNAWRCGRTTMQEILGDDEPFASTTNTPAGPQPVHVAAQAESYAVCVDTRGDHLICLLSEQATTDYLASLREKGVSYIVASADAVDLSRAMDLLGEHLAIRTLLVEGGGHINGGFLEAGLVNEISLLLVDGGATVG